MNKPKFTPSPWLYDEFIEWENSYEVFNLRNNKTHKDVIRAKTTMFVNKYDFYLIAAAPEMYHALECAFAVLKEDCPDEAATQIVEKSLAKARGE